MPREISDPDDKKPSDSVDDWTDKVAEGVDCTTVSLADFLVISAEVVIGVTRQNVLAIDSTRSALDLRSQFKYDRTTSTSCSSSNGVLHNPEASSSTLGKEMMLDSDLCLYYTEDTVGTQLAAASATECCA